MPPNYEVVTTTSNGPYNIVTACEIESPYWYCSTDDSFRAGLSDTTGCLEAEIPAGQSLTFSLKFDDNIDTSKWGDNPDFAILVETWDTQVGNIDVSMCADQACTDVISSAEWYAASASDSAYTAFTWLGDDESDRVLYKCGATVGTTYYVKLDNSHSNAVDAHWYFYPVIDSSGDCYYDDAVDDAGKLILILVLVGIGGCCCVAIICCVCMGGTGAACAYCCCAPKKEGGVQMATN